MTETIFFDLLKSSLWGGRVEVPGVFEDWKGVFGIAKTQSVLGLTAHAVLNDSDLIALLSDRTMARLRSFLMANVAAHAIMNNTLVQVVKTLNNAEVASVLLKGQALARNYPIPEMRACGDIDIYVGSQNYLKACEILGQIASWKEQAMPSENLKHYDIKIGKTTVEIHRFSDINPSRYYDRIYQAYSDEGLNMRLREMDFAGTTVNTPADDFNAFYIFNHLWHHFLTSGIGLRQFCDWMMFLHTHKDEIDKDKLKKIIDDMNLMIPWQSFGCVLVDKLGMPADEFPFYDSSKGRKVSKIVKIVLTEGNFGHEREFFKNRLGEGYLKRKIKSFFLHSCRSLQLFFIFPSHIARQYWFMLRRGVSTVWKDKMGCTFHN